MRMQHLTVAVSGLLLALLTSQSASADVLNMGGVRNADGSWTGLASLETVPVGDPGNAADAEVMDDDTTGYGAVKYTYNIGKHEVTAGQYCEFLNAVAKTDTYRLYSANMSYVASYGCLITRSGSPGSYTYSVPADWANRPVNYVDFGDACRFANWLHNGQPVGTQDDSTTEDGAYALGGATSSGALAAVTRNANWRWAVTNENEWYKAAYYDGASGSYYDYPMGSDNLPSNALLSPDGANNANFMDLNYTIGHPYYRTEVGAFTGGSSPYGTFDQAGNVYEWTESVVPSHAGPIRVLRGGCWNYYIGNLEACSRTPTDSLGAASFIGFRVVRAILRGDIDGDGHVNVFDIFAIAEHWNTAEGDPLFDPACDLDGDGAVNVFDIFVLAENWSM